jgi:hypothetical protein
MSVSKSTAERDPTSHVFERGAGYRHVGPPTVRPSREGNSQLVVPSSAPAGSAHWLSPPGGGRLVRATWTGKTRTWLVTGGNRLGFPTDYLSAHGWTYVGPAVDGEGPPVVE